MIQIVGTGNCGTGFIARVLISVGIKCSHEGIFNRAGLEKALHLLNIRRRNPCWGWKADSSWLAFPFLDEIREQGITVVHLVRHPRGVINSCLRTMLYKKFPYSPYHEWAEQYLNLAQYDTPAEHAAYRYLTINERIEPHADVFHRVEDDPRMLLDELEIGYEGREIFSNTKCNTYTGYGPANFDPDDIPIPLRERLLEMTERYGYEW